jgi:hypothetical protein
MLAVWVIFTFRPVRPRLVGRVHDEIGKRAGRSKLALPQESCQFKSVVGELLRSHGTAVIANLRKQKGRL